MATGGRVVEPDDCPGGAFYAPTILTGVRPEHRIAREEVFGPVLAVIDIDSFDEAIDVVNDCAYGLSAAIYTRDVNAAMAATQRIDTGIVYVNAPTIGAEIQLPFGGTKHTGNGYREAGRRGLEQFSETKTVYVDYSGRLQKAQIDNRPAIESNRRTVNGADIVAERAAHRRASTPCSAFPARTTSRCGPRASRPASGSCRCGTSRVARTRPMVTPRATGKVGVALVTTGPGAANTMGAVGEAWASRSPVVVIATDIPSSLRRPGVYRGVLHECTDQAALFAPVTKMQTTDTSAKRLLAATSAPTRPGVRRHSFRSPDRARGENESNPVPRRGRARDAFSPLVDALRRSERPLLWVGGGAREAGDEVDALARRLGAPVVTTYQARGLLPPDHPLLVPAPPHEPEITALIAASDLVDRHRLRPRPDEHDAMAAAASRRDASR